MNKFDIEEFENKRGENRFRVVVKSTRTVFLDADDIGYKSHLKAQRRFFGFIGEKMKRRADAIFFKIIRSGDEKYSNFLTHIKWYYGKYGNGFDYQKVQKARERSGDIKLGISDREFASRYIDYMNKRPICSY